MKMWLSKLKNFILTRPVSDEGSGERPSAFILTSHHNLSPAGIDCAACGKLLSRYDAASDTHEPPCERMLAEGKVPVPNFGWFCGQNCAAAYERKFGVHFQRNAEGKVEYYPE